MGKNANRDREKKNKFTEKNNNAADQKMQEMIDEAARRGCEVWELEEELKREEEEGDGSEEEQ